MKKMFFAVLIMLLFPIASGAEYFIVMYYDKIGDSIDGKLQLSATGYLLFPPTSASGSWGDIAVYGPTVQNSINTYSGACP